MGTIDPTPTNGAPTKASAPGPTPWTRARGCNGPLQAGGPQEP